MVIKITGWIWFCVGIILLLFPGLLRQRILRKGNKIIRKYLFAVMLVIIAALMTTGLKIAGGMRVKLFIAIGIILIVKFTFTVKSNFARKTSVFLQEQPLLFFRVVALAQAVTGLFMILFAR